MKYKTIGAFKNVQNVPYCKAAEDLKVGMGVLVDRVNKTVRLPDSANEAKTVDYIVSNIIDKPEIRNFTDFVIKQGEYVRADHLATVLGMEIEFAEAEISTAYANIIIGDRMIFDYSTGKLVVDNSNYSNYDYWFEVIDYTGYMGSGVLCVINGGDHTFGGAALNSIAITANPTAGYAYTVGDTLALAGMVVTATYGDGHTAAVTTYTTTPANGATLAATNTKLTVSYTEHGITKTCEKTLTVS